MYSATGTAFAPAADVTWMPRSQQAGVMWCLTLPAAWTTARSRGAAARTSAVSGGAPQQVMSSSAPASTRATSGVGSVSRWATRAGSVSTSAVRRARCRAPNSCSAMPGPMARRAVGAVAWVSPVAEWRSPVVM